MKYCYCKFYYWYLPTPIFYSLILYELQVFRLSRNVRTAHWQMHFNHNNDHKNMKLYVSAYKEIKLGIILMLLSTCLYNRETSCIVSERK